MFKLAGSIEAVKKEMKERNKRAQELVKSAEYGLKTERAGLRSQKKELQKMMNDGKITKDERASLETRIINDYDSRIESLEKELEYQRYCRDASYYKLSIVPMDACGRIYDYNLLQRIERSLKGFDIAMSFEKVNFDPKHIGTVEVLVISYTDGSSKGRFEIKQLPSHYHTLEYAPVGDAKYLMQA